MYTIKRFILLITVLSLSLFPFVKAQTVEVRIINVRTDVGQIYVGVFDSQEAFKKEDGFYRQKIIKSEIEDGNYSITIKLSPGTYGISVLDDVNMDGKMNYNLIGIPTEGYGFSGFKHRGLKRPVFDDFSFTIEEGQHIQFDVELRYFELNFKK
ncbi:MAG TPA: DUF2141 domain-containing protein [Paludibacter sp.]|jgi:uncharacterized protein (DUF2141 family)|nr:DUF2141 domain-containing protein [Paludibacter sp.]